MKPTVKIDGLIRELTTRDLELIAALKAFCEFRNGATQELFPSVLVPSELFLKMTAILHEGAKERRDERFHKETSGSTKESL